jgi:HSP20 family molecular chaperone IbpA
MTGALNRSLEGSIWPGRKAGIKVGRESLRVNSGAKESFMKGTRGFGIGAGGRGPCGPVDLGTIFDEIFEAAQNFQDEFRKNFKNPDNGCRSRGPEDYSWIFDENTDYYPNYSYPPMNVYMTGDRSLIFEFALAGFEEKDICLSFQGDYMVFSALMPKETMSRAASEADPAPPEENVRYFKRRLKMKTIEKQKYFVPLDKYAQDKVKAVFRNGILRVSIPPKEEPDQSEGIKIEIISGD